MAVNLLPDKLNFVSKLSQNTSTILDALAANRLIIQEAIDAGYTSGPNVITDADLNTAASGTAPFPKLVALDVLNGILAMQGIDTTLAATTRAGYKAMEKLRP